MIEKLLSARNSLDRAILNKSFVKAVASAFALIFLITIPILIWVFVNYFEPFMDQNETDIAYATSEYVVAIMISVVVAPIVESVLLGGLLLGLRKINIPTFFAILIAALIFSLVHENYPFAKFPQFVVYSYVFLYSLRFTNKFNACARISAVHALNNFTFAVLPMIVFS